MNQPIQPAIEKPIRTAGGGKGIYNLSPYEAGYGPFYVGLNIPQPIDVSRVPNFKNAHPLFRTGAAVLHEILHEMGAASGNGKP